ncbi:unnamed protein product, partial [Meganyctiphanes norvegica]
MEEDTEYLKLPLEDRCIHKAWKARMHGYEECAKVFPRITDEKSPEFSKFAPLMKKFVTDSNAVAQEKALDAVLLFVENAHVAGRTTGDVVAGCVLKCLAAPKRGTQEKATEIILMYCEIEKYEVVVEELVKGFTQKNPKVVAACVRVLATALRAFGHKVIGPKQYIKHLTTLLEHRDVGVREAGKQLVIDLHRWIGPALKPQLSALKPVQVQELESEFEKLGKEKVVQTRFLRSQQDLRQKMEAQGEDGEEEEDEEEDGPEEKEIDPYEFMEPVDIVSKLPKNFYELIEAKKWQERKEALDALLPLSESPRIEPGDFHELMKALKKVISKDTNVMLVTLAAKCTSGLARGLKKKFHPFSLAFTETILEKCKEKKPMVVAALKDAIDQVFLSTSIEAIQETACGFLGNKNPSVKAETAGFLARSFCYCTPQMLNKKLIKAYVEPLIKTLNEPDPTVRDNSAEALGTMWRVVGEKIMMVFLADIEALKMQKIKESSEKVELKVKIAAPKKPKAAKKEPEPPKAAAPSGGGGPSTTAPKKKVVKGGGAKAAGASGPAGGKKANSYTGSVRGKGGGGGGGGGAVEECRETEIGLEEALEKAGEVLPSDVMTGLLDANWKSRLAAMETFNTTVSGMERSDIPCQALVRTLAQKPGFKDNNFQVLKLRLEALKILAENSDFTRRSGEVCIQDLVEKIGDPKNGSNCCDALTAIAEAAKLQWVGPEVMTRAFEQKSPKVQEVALKWLAEAITDFGFVLNPKALIGDIKKALGHTNPGVRTAGIALCGVIYLYMGATLKVFFEDEKPALQQQIDTEFEKQSGKSPPVPTRGVTRGSSQDDDGEDGDDVDTGGPATINVQDLVPRVDISSQITDNLMTEFQDKNWKVRNEALNTVSRILQEAKFINKDIGELPKALCGRMTDLNKNLALEALKITANLATALGPNCKPHTRNIVPGMLQGMGDSKPHIRQQAISSLNMWTEQVGVKEVIDAEMFSEALKAGSPFLKAEVFGWMAEKLKDIPPGKNSGVNKEEINACTPHLFTALEDRNADVRKGANEAVLPFMIHIGYEGISKHLSRVKPASKNTIQQILEKAKPNLPARPPPPAKAGKAAGGRQGSTVEKVEKPAAASKAPAAKKGVRAPSANRGASASRKDSEDVDTSPLLAENNQKSQRASDEQRLKVLRWDFPTPRQEFITQLTDQMTAANFNRLLIANMFHKDFKFHIKAIESLNEDLNENLSACVANLDLVLRWMTIRFFDTNPSVVMKGMDYLTNVFTMLSEDGFHMIDHEAYAFLPFLIMKFGDPKEPIRGPARAISKLICNIYPASKVSPYLLEGLKAKNARQRAECLDGIGGLIEIYGMSVCQPSVGVMMKEVAKQIADRDNNVRNAALNALVQVFFREGEKVYKMVGSLADKDLSLLEERIKRAAKNRPVIKKPPPEPEAPVVRAGKVGGARGNRVVPTLAAPAPVINRDRDRGDDGNAQSAGSDLRSRFGIRQNANPNAPFKIDYGLIEKLLEDDGPADRPQYNLEEIPDMNSILNYNPVLPVSASTRLTRPGFTAPRSAPATAQIEPEGAAQAINMVISQVATPDANTVITALSQLDEVLKSEERREQLLPHIDQLLIVATLQYRLVLNTKMANANVNKEECIKIYRSLTHCLITLILTMKIGVNGVQQAISEIATAMTYPYEPTTIKVGDKIQNLFLASINMAVIFRASKAKFLFKSVILPHNALGNSPISLLINLASCRMRETVSCSPTRCVETKKNQHICLKITSYLINHHVNANNDKPYYFFCILAKLISTRTYIFNKIFGIITVAYFTQLQNRCPYGRDFFKLLVKIITEQNIRGDNVRGLQEGVSGAVAALASDTNNTG